MTVPAALSGDDWAWLRTTVRERVEADGGAVSVVLDLSELEPGEQDTLRWLLGWKVTDVGRKRVTLERLDRELRRRVTDGISLRETLAALSGGVLADRRAERQSERARRAAEALAVHAELVALTASCPDLAAEHRVLAAAPPQPVLRVPAGSAAGTSKWPVYEAALRAAVLWFRKSAASERVSAKELAGQAWRNTKRWTLPRQLAFTNLIQRQFEQAVDEADTEVRLRGPLTWVAEGTIADAAACRPWLSVPAQGLRTLGYTTCAAHGILLIENLEAFERVCELPEVSERWLCVWGQGYVRDGVVRFLRSLDLPLAAWGDLDADGIRIITDVGARVGRPIRAVGMSTRLWQQGVKREQTPDQLHRGRVLAASLSASCAPDLRELAAAIATTGEGCEQETLYTEVLPTLGVELAKVLADRP